MGAIVVAIGSRNRLKVRAVKAAFRKMYPERKFSFVILDVPSGVPPQPFGDESVVGAINRARLARKRAKAEIGVGIEGGIRDHGSSGRFAEAWCAVVSRGGRAALGRSAGCRIPSGVLKRVRAGREPGEATDDFFGTTGVGRREGFFGVMTRGRITRAQALVACVLMALADRENIRK
jgi:inosine/xanthosine triphosphatase